MARPNALAGFFRGLCFPVLGWRFLHEHPALWRYTYWPTFLNALFTAVLLALFGYAAWELSVYARVWIPPTWWGWALRGLFYATLAFLALGLVTACSLALCAVWASVFLGRLTFQVERALGTPAADLPGLSVRQEIGEACLSLRDVLAVGLVILVLGFLPVVGPVLSLAVGWYCNAFTLGMESLDYPWALRGMPRARKRELARHYRGETLGVGTLALVVGWVPLLGSVVLSLAVVGSVLWNFDNLARPKQNS